MGVTSKGMYRGVWTGPLGKILSFRSKADYSTQVGVWGLYSGFSA